MLLSEILADFEYTAVGTVDGMEIADIVYDSRRADAAGCRWWKMGGFVVW